MSRVVEPQENSVHSKTDPADRSSRIETQSFRSGNGSFEVNVTWRSGRPTERIVPATRIEWDAGGVVSNLTWTPGSTVSVTPEATRMSPMTRYGLPGRLQVVFVVKVPDTEVGPARTIRSSGVGKNNSRVITNRARRATARRTGLVAHARYLSSVVRSWYTVPAPEEFPRPRAVARTVPIPFYISQSRVQISFYNVVQHPGDAWTARHVRVQTRLRRFFGRERGGIR